MEKRSGFVVPNDEQRRQAVGDLTYSPLLVRKSIEVMTNYFGPIHEPGPSDWLANHKESGETFQQFLNKSHAQISAQCSTILIQPLDLGVPAHFTKCLQDYCKAFFLGSDIEVGEPVDLDMMGVKNRINSYSKKIQFDADGIIGKLRKEHLKKHVFCVIGFTMRDLYPEEAWNFVFGMASLFQRTGVFSFARYDERFFGTKPYTVDYDKLLFQTLQVMVHEIAHMFGLEHCIFYNCVMNGANNLEESKKQPLELCPVCLRKLQASLQFDILERYCGLLRCLDGKSVDPAIETTCLMLRQVISKLQTQLN